MDLLPEDILIEILVKLPTKSLMICCCVCKIWRDLILSFYFGDKHLVSYYGSVNNHKTETMIFFTAWKHKWGKNYPHRHQEYLLSSKRDSVSSSLEHTATVFSGLEWPSDSCLLPIQSCNGILCFVKFGSIPYYLCNPITRDCFTLPTSTVFPKDEGYQTKGIGFIIGNCIDSSSSTPSALSNNYKIVRIVARLGVENRYAAEIYKHTTNCWSEVDINDNQDLIEDYDTIESLCVHREYRTNSRLERNYQWDIINGELLNGCFHWLVLVICHYRFARFLIITFDFQGEIFGRMETPAAISWHKYERETVLTVLHGSLAFFVQYDDDSDSIVKTRIEVWVMREYGNKESWTKTFNVVFPPPPPSYGSESFWVATTGWNKEILTLNKYGEMFSYSLAQDQEQQEAQFRVVKNIDPQLIIENHPSFIFFQPTLVALSGRLTS